MTARLTRRTRVAAKHGNCIAWVLDRQGVRNIWIAGAPAFTPRQVTKHTPDYARLSPTPKAFDIMAGQMGTMWATEPNWSDAQLGTIRSPVWIVDGDHEEFIKLAHTEHIAATIPGAGLLILPNASHFAPWQVPALFNAAVLQFLDGNSATE